MTGVGIAWTSILSMPYAMLGGVLPRDKIGIYMGIFNFFIVLPEIIASLGFKWIMNNVLNNDMMLAVQTGGFLMILAAAICFFFIREKNLEPVSEATLAEMEILGERPI
jgi:maltose/moltooligosaccharide transporter